jgi:aspartokinase/homoserine dehydrogenase 1
MCIESANSPSHKSQFGGPIADPCSCGIDTSSSSAKPLGRHATRSSSSCRSSSPRPDDASRVSGSFSDRFLKHRPVLGLARRNAKKPLRVMKFGGTSVGDASCIASVAAIVRAASRESSLVVVVSAMSGVTNKLIEAATISGTGDRETVAAILDDIRQKHHSAISALVNSAADRNRIGRELDELFHEADRLCQNVILTRELSLRTLDSISSLGERLSAPLVAAALAECGVAGDAIEATRLVVTNSNHGAADPRMDLTRERCETRLRPLLHQGIVPVVTGFIGATTEGVRTTLGRGGSDYSATILGAALNADEVIIWTDVDGLLTADPRMVPGTCTIPEISYGEAADLAYFGAKVLHPKTLRSVAQAGIPVWIRNTFAPDQPGTKITPTAPPSELGVKALTAISDVALITVAGPGIVGVPNVLGRTFTTTAAIQADVLLISQSSSQNDICFVVSSASATRTVEALRHEFALDLAHETVEHITVDPDVAIVTMVGQKLGTVSGIVGRTFGALGRENLNVIAIAQGASGCNVSLVVARRDVKATLVAAHQEFRLGTVNPSALPVAHHQQSNSHPARTVKSPR